MDDQSLFLAWQQSRQSRRSDRSWGAGDEDRTLPDSNSEGWIRLATLCCKLDIPIFNPTLASVNTRSGRGNLKSFIARQAPGDFRGRNAVLKACQIQTDHEGKLNLDFRTIVNEVIILSNPALRLHPNLARLIGVTWEEEPPELDLGLSPALVLDFADGGTLADLVQRKPPLSFTAKAEIFCGVGEALLALHRCGIVHGDVKMENVLIQTEQNGRHVPKLTDFDLSMRIPHSSQPLPGYTRPWNAPEVLEELCHRCMELTDVYS
jgi:serine/threonine protein kinase